MKNDLILVIIPFLLGIGNALIGMWIYAAYKENKKSKEGKDDIVFSRSELEKFLINFGHKLIKNISKDFEIVPKDSNIFKKLCGSWCNPDDTRRYYISDRGGYYVLAIEDRIRLSKPMECYILREPLSGNGRNIFYAENDICKTFGYNPDEDRLFDSTIGEELERCEVRYPQRITENGLSMSDIEEALELGVINPSDVSFDKKDGSIDL